MDDLESVPESRWGRSAEDPKALEVARTELKARCEAAGFPIQEETVSGVHTAWVGFPCGRDRCWISAMGSKGIERLLSVQFERFVFLGSYLAVCSYEDETIFAGVHYLDSSAGFTFADWGSAWNFVAAQPEFKAKIRQKGEPLASLETTDPAASLSIELNDVTDPLGSLIPYGYMFAMSLQLTLKGVAAKQWGEATNLLERVSDSLFFQIDALSNVPLGLTRFASAVGNTTEAKSYSVLAELEFPRYSYDRAPMALYRYARSAAGMPLLQYLALYQVLEYYFPTYAEAEARRRAKGILREPSFRVERDSDLGRLVTAVRGGRGTHPDERSQLRATLRECLDSGELREFVTSRTELREATSVKKKSLPVHLLPVQNENADLRDDVADRIYEIRCRIVHTKGVSPDEESGFFLPFSREADQLGYDIQLLQFVAHKVIVAAGTTMEL